MKVICTDTKWDKIYEDDVDYPDPAYGETCTVIGILTDEHGRFYSLEEYPNDWFNAEGFSITEGSTADVTYHEVVEPEDTVYEEDEEEYEYEDEEDI